MQPAAHDSGVVRFDVFVFDPRAEELHREGLRLKLQGQPLQVLAILLEQPGHLVTREELRKRLWPEDTFVDFDHSLNTAIKKLRHALRDDARKPRFVETLPRRGYRFIGALESKEAISPPEQSMPQEQSLAGSILALRSDTGAGFVLLPVDVNILKEKQSLEAAHDDLGLSLLVASQKILLVSVGTKVRVLEAAPPSSSHLVRILEGEHIGLTALAPAAYLAELEGMEPQPSGKSRVAGETE